MKNIEITSSVLDDLEAKARAAYELGRHSYGFEIKKEFYKDAKEKMLSNIQFQKSLLHRT